jgi:protein-tyrosine phosphatase
MPVHARSFAVDILVVCTANRARSPAAELLFRREAHARLGAGHGLVIRSAGVHAEAGAPVLSTMAAALERHELRLDGYASRPLDAAEVEASGLVVTMTEAHRQSVNRIEPTAVSRTYTLRELERLVSAPQWDPAWDGTDDVYDRLRRIRPLVPKADRPEDILDPAGRRVEIAVAIVDELSERISRVSQHLFGPAPFDDLP